MLIRNAQHFANAAPVAGDPIAALVRDNTGLTNSAQYPDGWTCDITFKGNGLGTHTPDGSKVVFNVTTPGYVAGALTTINRTVTGTLGLRLINPNDTLFFTTVATDTVITYALDSRIYPGDTISSVTVTAGAYGASNTKTLTGAAITNSSGLTYKKPVAKFETPYDLEAPSGTTTFRVEVTGTHWAARNGQQFCCIDFIATDESANTATATISSPSVSTTITGANANGVYAETWAWDVPLAGLNQDEKVTVRFKAKPWIGDATAILDSDPSADGFAYLSAGCSQLSNLTFLNNKTGAYGLPYAYVDSTLGNDGTGVVSVTTTIASASPFATIKGAGAAIQTYCNSGVAFTARNNAGNGRIRLKNNSAHTSFGATMAAVVAGKCWLIVEDDPANVGNAIFTSAVGSASNTAAKIACDLLMVRGRITIQPPDTVSGSQTMMYSGSVAGNGKRLFLGDGLTFSGFTSVNTPVINGFQWQFYRNFACSNMGGAFFAGFSTNVVNFMLIAGVVQTGVMGNLRMSNVIGCLFTSPTGVAQIAAAQTKEDSDGFILHDTIILKSLVAIYICNSIGVTRGASISGLLVENTDTTATSPCFQFGADGSTGNSSNVNIDHCLFIGNRTNWFYTDDDASINTTKTGVCGHNIMEQDNRKSDTFLRASAPAATIGTAFQRTGGWRGRYRVDQGPELYLGPDFSGIAVPPGQGIGERVHPGSKFTQTASNAEATIAAQRALLFNNPLAGPSLGGGGDYTWKAPVNATYELVAAGAGRRKYDLLGNLRKQDGTGMPGPYERP